MHLDGGLLAEACAKPSFVIEDMVKTQVIDLQPQSARNNTILS